jgi:hypothetical protein
MKFAKVRGVRCLITLAIGSSAWACGDEQGGTVAGVEGPGTRPAVVVQLNVSSPEQPASLVGVFPELPSGELDTSRMIEVLGYPSVRTLGGDVYVYSGESGVMTRYAVTDQMTLENQGDLSFQGVASNVDYLDLQLLDRGLAYGASFGGLLIEFDPGEMVITRTLQVDLPSPVVPSQLDSTYGSARFEGSAVWNIYGNDYGALTYNDQAMLGFLEVGADALQVVSEPRCAPNLKNYLIGGDLYVIGAATNAEVLRNYSGYASPAPNCVLRVRAGQRSFDPSYFINLTDIVQSTAIEIVNRLDDEHILVQFWDSEEPFPENIEDYYAVPNFKSLKVNLQTGAAEPLAIFPKGNLGSYVDFVVDGISYYPAYEQRSGEVGAGSTTLQRIEGGQLSDVFHATGSVTQIVRVR